NLELLNFDEDTLYKRHVCGDHFLASDFVSNARHRLKPFAIPQQYDGKEEDDLHIIPPLHTYTHKKPDQTDTKLLSPESSTSISILELHTPPKTNQVGRMSFPSSETKQFINDVILFPTPIKQKQSEEVKNEIIDTPKKKKLRSTIQNQRKIIKNKRSTICKLRSNLKSYRQELNAHKHLLNKIKYSSKGSKVLTKMQLFHGHRKCWTQAEKNFSIGLFYKSPATYKYLRNKQNIILPGVSTIKKWIGSSKFMPGFNTGFLKQLQLKIETMTNEEKYCVVVFDEMSIKKYLEYSKYLDMVEGFEDLGHKGRTNKIASLAMVFIARGLYSRWKMPITYFLSASSMKHDILSELIIEVVEKLNRIGLSVTAIVCDQGTNNVAALKKLGISKEKPYFNVGTNTIFSIFDVPHIIKNFRNNLLKDDFIYKGQRITFNDIKKTYDIDKSSGTSRALLKITDSHIQPGPFQKMSCKLALQVFSHSVAATMKTCITTGQLTTSTASATADFIEEINRTFDCLNSKKLYTSNPYTCAISEERPGQLNLLLNSKNWCEQLRKTYNGKETRPPCFDGLVQTINAIQMLYIQQQKLGYTFLLTSRLNQDVIENLFSVFRQRGGFNRNPTAKTFRTTFRINILVNLIKSSDASNCYLGYKCFKEFKCNDCTHIFLKADEYFFNEQEFLIFYKSYESNDPEKNVLNKPTEMFTLFIQRAQKIISAYIIQMPETRNLCKMLQKKIKLELFSLLQLEKSCDSHFDYIFNSMFENYYGGEIQHTNVKNITVYI
ncbi:Uncharacterized protein FWK35_00034244, partial [Aphis craccivora]